MKTLPPLDNLAAEELERLVTHHNRLYWDENAPEISDTDFDRLVRQLTRVSPDSSILDALGPTNFGAEVVHKSPMLSLDKCYSDSEISKFMGSFKGEVVISPKIDGVACSISYGSDGKLALAATRGDGKRGEEITANARRVKDIPAKINSGDIEVRGELYMTRSRFKKKYAKDFANPRNLTAGAIKQKDSNKCADYGLSFFAYDLLGADVAGEWEKNAWLKKQGFKPTVAERVKVSSVLDVVHKMAGKRADYDYETDGVVIKADSLAEQKRLGFTAHHPRYAIAFKFQGETGETTLKEVEWSVSRTGTVTPVAIFDPIFLSGGNLSRASLHHAGYIDKLALSEQCTVAITRRGDVIPHVEKVVAAGGKKIQLPKKCPSCSSDLERVGDFLRCTNPDECADALVGTLEHFTKVLDIDGFGKKLLQAVVEKGIVRRPVDFFKLTPDDLMPLERMGKKLAQKLVKAVAERKAVTLPTFLTALGIDELGPVMAEQLANHYGDLKKLSAASQEDLASLHGVGEVVARNVATGLTDMSRRIEELLQVMQLKAAAAPVVSDNIFSGKSVVFTGKMALMDRKSAQKQVRDVGGKTPSSATKDLDYLVIGDEGSPLLGAGSKSSKQKTAEKHIAAGAGIQIISESDFVKKLEGK